MTAIGSISSLSIDQLRATVAAAKVPLVTEEAPRPPAATQREVEAGRLAVERAKADAAAAAQKVQDDRTVMRGRGFVV